MPYPDADLGTPDPAQERPPLLLRLLPVGFALAGLYLLGEGLVVLWRDGGPLTFLRQEVSQAELMSLLLPRGGILLAGAALLSWALEHRPRLAREVAIALPGLLFVIAIASAAAFGYSLSEAWYEAGWRPLVTALALAALVYGSGDAGRYLARVGSSPDEWS